MSGLEGNPKATSSGVAGSATSSSIEAGLLLRQPLVRTIRWMGVSRLQQALGCDEVHEFTPRTHRHELG